MNFLQKRREVVYPIIVEDVFVVGEKGAKVVELAAVLRLIQPFPRWRTFLGTIGTGILGRRS